MSGKLNLNKKLLIPVRRARRTAGAFVWGDQITLGSEVSPDALPLKRLGRTLRKLLGARSRIVRDADQADVRITRKDDICREGYRMVVSPGGVEILASDDAGAYYGVMTVCELVRVFGRKLPGCVIDDQPDFRRRGVYMDCSRGKVPTVETVKALVERLAAWKINELQLYFENVFKFASHPKIGRGYSPYTAADVLEIQEHCRLHHVRLVGSQATFGHLEKVLALREYQSLGELPGFRGYRGGMTLCPGDPGSISLVKDMLGELAPLFDSSDFNICGDEPWELGQGRSKRSVGRLGVGTVYLRFLKKVIAATRRLGKRANIWADIVLAHPELLDELPDDITLLNWEYEAKGPRIARTEEIAASGLPFMVCPGTSSWLTHGTRLDNAMANVRNFAAAGRKYGAQGLLNTDWGDYGHRNFLGVSLHGLAHGGAHGWYGRGADEATFTRRFCEHTFGSTDEQLARAIQQLGAVRDMAGCRLYYALVERAGAKDGEIAKLDTDGAYAVVEQLSASGLWAPTPTGLDKFERIAIKELKLACEMDLLACRRALMVRDLRAGIAVSSSEQRRMTRRLEALGEKFQLLWLMRNRKSRLIDNLRMLGRAGNYGS
ncbi:MAG: family 20 glycosylhydrolase [Phycisphaerales bacterium]|jgi:hexosaminidase|nr:family 20 glycosylhydrolase [Phycisphaerales bacterium]